MIDYGVSYEYTFVIAAAILFVLLSLNLIYFAKHALRHLRKNTPDNDKQSDSQASFLKKITSKLPLFNRKMPNPFADFITKDEIEKEDFQAKKLTSKKIKFKALREKITPVTKFLGKHGLLLINLILISSLAYLIYDLTAHPDIAYSYPHKNNEELFNQHASNVTVTFDRPLKEDMLQPYIFPEIKGEWKIEPVNDKFPWIKRKVTFYPKETILPGSKVFIYYAGIANHFYPDGNGWEFGITTFSDEPANVSSVTPEDKAKDIGIEENISFIFDKPVDKYALWNLDIEPDIEYEQAVNNDQVTFDFTNNLSQSQKYTYKLMRTLVRYDLEKNEIIERANAEEVATGSFTTIKEPLISTIEPEGSGVLVDAPVKIVFDQVMEQLPVTEGFKLEPAVEGELKWQDDKTLIYEHADFKKDQKYTISFPKGLPSVNGGITEQKIEHNFTTIGRVQVSSFYPATGASGVGRGTNINVTFNQQVDHASAQSKFSISPSVSGSFAWDGNTLIFNPSADLEYGTTYTISMASGVKTVHGLDSNQNYSSSFSTETQYFVLDVPVYYQSQRFECNLIATSMALAYKGSSVSVGTLWSQVAKDSTPRTDDANGNIQTWGNPYSGFVGDINGEPNGYGVYWGPISSLANNYRSTAVRTGWNRTSLLQEVEAGNPVVIWAHNGYSYSVNGAVGSNISWQTPGGQSIYAIAGMHSYVVVGWIGNINNPTHIIVNDSNRGRWTITTSYFDGLWSYFNNSGVVIY